MNSKELRELFQFTYEELGQILGVRPETIHCWEDGGYEISYETGNQRVASWFRIAKIFGRILELSSYPKSNKSNFAKLWLHALNPLLGEISPRDFIKKHQKIEKFTKFLEKILKENYDESVVE